MPSTGSPPSGFRRRFRFIGLPECAVRVVAADAAQSKKEGVRSVGVDVDFDPRLDESGRIGLCGIWSLSVR